MIRLYRDACRPYSGLTRGVEIVRSPEQVALVYRTQ